LGLPKTMGQVCHAITHQDKDVQASWGKAETDAHNPDLNRERYTRPTSQDEEHEVQSEYESEEGEEVRRIVVKIDKARGLRNADWMPGTGKSDPYCVVKYKSGEVHRTQVINDTVDPVWNDSWSKEDYVLGEPLEFHVFDDDGPMKPADFLGYAVVDYEVFKGTGFSGEIQLQDAGRGILALLHLQIKLDGEPHFVHGPPPEFVVTVDRQPGDAKPLGLKVDTQDTKTAYITEIEDGLCKDLNDKVDHDKRGHHIRRGDFIVRVNEKSENSQDILEELNKEGKLEIHIKRAMEITVPVDRTDPSKEALGLHFKDPIGYSLIIAKKVDTNSAVDKWNKSRDIKTKRYKVGHATQEEPTLTIKEGDRIIAVGGLAAKAGDLHRRITSKDTAKFSFTAVRPVGPVEDDESSPSPGPPDKPPEEPPASG